jgi:hypothetical protein
MHPARQPPTALLMIMQMPIRKALTPDGDCEIGVPAVNRFDSSQNFHFKKITRSLCSGAGYYITGMQTPAEWDTGEAPTPRTSDRELLSRFLTSRDESAFAEIVSRYSRLVMSVARHTLRDAHAADDAFQATFLVLARAARRIRNRESLAS